MNPPPPFPPPYYPPPPPPPFTYLPQPQLPPAPHLLPPPEAAARDLPTALSALTSLLSLTETNLKALSPFLPTPASSALIPCPFNPNHLLPRSSLFSHYLSCPSSLTPIPDPHCLLRSLHYPQTLHSTSTNSFNQSLRNPAPTELCLSLESLLDFPQNFFYSSCLGAVIIDPSSINDSSTPMLTLPGLLSSECADFGRNNNFFLDEMGFLPESIRILPSEIWAVRNEIEGWVNYPLSYSYRLLRSILRLCNSDLSPLLTRVIDNSSKYGVVLDLAMRDHIILLFKLCLKAIIREAIGLSDLLFSGKREDKGLGPGEKTLNCPVLMEVLMWLGSQLSVLYGEVSGNSFAINMLKQCVLDSALSSSCFPLMEKAKESSELKELDGKLEGAFENSGKEERGAMVAESVQNSSVFVSQVASAVAALYERSWLEEKIKKSRDTRQLTTYQRFVEHANVSKIAHEERQKRSDYRPIIEHDGVLSKRTQNQEPNRIKTREELLAEERDYKRRRMSYRGKKMKRTTTQVMRDIIDEFMDEIKLASGLGFAKEAEGAESIAYGSSSVHNSAPDSLECTRNQLAPKLPREEPCVSGIQLYSDYGRRSMDSEDKYRERHKKHKRDSLLHYESIDYDRNSSRKRHDRRDYSKSPDRRKSDRQLHERTRNRNRNRDDPEASREIISRRSDGNLSKLHEGESQRREESRHDSKLRHKQARKKHKDHRSDAVHSEFEDRYDPSKTHYNSESDA